MQEAGAEDKLFATLDTRIRSAWLSNRETVLLVDTVGFIHGLPHDLVAAFRATLEGALFADVLVRITTSMRGGVRTLTS
jgi:GTPase